MHSLFFLLLLSQYTGSEQQYDYNKRNIYIFSVKFINTINNTLTRSDTVGMFCTGKRSDGFDSSQRIMNWSRLKKKDSSHYDYNQTEIVGNTSSGTKCEDSELFIHPPRDGYYDILQICPYPYIVFPLAIHKEWNWQFEVGDSWISDPALKWKGNELFRFHYAVTDTSRIVYQNHQTFCYKIQGTSTSCLGVASSEMYYSYDYGIMKIIYHTLNHQKIELTLIDINNDTWLYRNNAALYDLYTHY